MAWENRSGKGRYYTRSRRVNGLVIREYYGTGAAGQLAAAEHARERLKRIEETKHRLELIRRLTKRYSAMRLADSVADAIVEVSLAKLGYHQYRGATWRKKRGQ
jgi:hypothetical protein